MVFGNWLDRLCACAYCRGADRRGSRRSPTTLRFAVIPPSALDNHLSPAVNLAALDAVFASVNRGRSVQIPTAVGFCMYIRRNAWRRPDSSTSRPSERVRRRERLLHADGRFGMEAQTGVDVFVYHAGSVSFGSPSARQEAAMRTMIARYPSYPELVRRHVQADPAKAFRIAVTAQRIRNSGKRVFLVRRPCSGRRRRRARRPLAELTSGAIWLKLRPLSPHSVVLECAAPGYEFSLTLDPCHERETLATLIRACGVERIHIHHLMEHSAGLSRLLQDTSGCRSISPFTTTIRFVRRSR